jgi:AcrR family transcriptional regulator
MTRTRLSPAERRTQIVQDAIVAFDRQPWNEISFESLAAQVGVSPPLIRHYFGTKRGLFLATVHHLGDQLATLLTRDRSDLPAQEVVRATFDDYLDFVERNDWAHRLWMTAAADPDASETIDELRGQLAEIILGRPRAQMSEALELRMWGWIGFIEAAISRYLADRGRFRRDVALDLLAGSMDMLRSSRG